MVFGRGAQVFDSEFGRSVASIKPRVSRLWPMQFESSKLYTSNIKPHSHPLYGMSSSEVPESVVEMPGLVEMSAEETEELQEHHVQYYVDLTVEDLAKIDKDPMYVQEVAARAILSNEEMANWIVNESVQSQEIIPETLESVVDNDAVVAEEPALEQTETINDVTAGDAVIFQWPKPAVKELIDMYHEMRPTLESKTSSSHKQTWQIMSDRLNERGFSGISSAQVYTKWRGLKKQFQKIQATGGRSAKNRRTWQFYEPMKRALARERQSSGRPKRKIDVASDKSPADSHNLTLPWKSLPRLTTRSDVATGSSGAGRRAAATNEEMPGWVRQLWSDLEERRRERQAERQRLVGILNRIADKLDFDSSPTFSADTKQA